MCMNYLLQGRVELRGVYVYDDVTYVYDDVHDDVTYVYELPVAGPC